MGAQKASGLLKPNIVAAVSASASAIALPGGGDLPNCIYIGATGNPVLTVNGASITFNALAAGVWHPMPNFSHVTAAGGATGIIVGRTE